MMCWWRLSSLPHSDDVLGIVSTCLPVATLSLHLACTLSLERIIELCSRRIKTSSRVTGLCPMRSLSGQWWKNNSTYKNHRGFAVVPPVDRNLRSRQECVRAWSWLSSKQISMRRQVCLVCLHSCACLQLFSLLSGATFTMWCVVKQECWQINTLCEVFSWKNPEQKFLKVL